LQLRIAEIQNAEDVTRVINAAFKKAESFLIERDRIEVEKVREMMGTGQFLVAEEAGTIAGCVYVERRGERAYLGLLAVGPSLQKSGLGSKLMTVAEEHCRAMGCGFVDLQIVNLRKELPEFYRKRGYVETGTGPFTAGIETKVPCHFIKMAKDLGQKRATDVRG